MQPITVRLATPIDLNGLADIWQENKVLHQQFDAGISLIAGAKTHWTDEAAKWLTNARCTMWVAVSGEVMLGYIVVWVHDMPPGVAPRTVGCVTEMALDLHTSSNGAGALMLNAAREWLANQEIENMIAYVPHRQPVQQAFWRGQGAKDWMDLMWLRL